MISPAAGKEDSLKLEEVQEALQADGLAQLKAGDWANAAFMEKLTANPTLCKAMADPQFASVLQSMQKDPVRTMKALESNAEAKEMMTEMLKLIGEHLTTMPDGDQAAKQKQQRKAAPQIVPHEESKLQAEADRVLKDDRIRSILADPETKRVLQQCGLPEHLLRYLHHPTWGPRLKLLQENGLVQFLN